METQTIKQFSNTREARARQILDIAEPQELDENTYLVPSQFDSNKKYEVTYFDTYSCNCKDFQMRCKGKGLYCKHIKAILLFRKLKNKYDVEDSGLSQEIELIINTPKKDVCPYCQSEQLIKRGVRKTQSGDKQRFSCKKCKKRFVLTPIPKIKASEKLVCLAMDCYYKGLSYRDISDQFKQFYGLSISHVTIRSWILKFGHVIEKYTKELKPKTSGVWNADETMVLTKRGKDKKNPNTEFDYVWNVMDNKSKFLLASVNSGRSRNKKDAKKVMTEAWKQNKKMPNQIITDRLPSYQDGIRKTFRNWGNERKVKHTSIVGKRKIVNNNAVENLHTHQKEFQKVRRGIKEVQDYADGFKVYHNFIRKGVKDKLSPAERCGIMVNGNRWNTLLLNSLSQVPNLTGEENMIKSP
jgi:transposase-like protein